MFSDVKHASIFNFFEEISKIPRGSGNEKGIADYLEAFAKNRHLYCYRDSVNNIFIRKDATDSEKAKLAPIALQGHTDMVCEANAGVKHDFLTDGIKLVRERDILRADGTTLGADNGAAVAIMLALLDSDNISHPTLECLFTVGEEVGMDGMTAFDTSVMKSRRMINLDSAGEGIATVACAGGVRCDFSKKCETVTLANTFSVYSLKVSGLYGGHSGEDINSGRSNAIEAVAKILKFIAAETEVRICEFIGGDKDNAIPRECTAVFAVDKNYDYLPAFESAISLIKHNLTDDDKNMRADIKKSNRDSSFTADDSLKIIDFISAFKSGPVMMSKSIENMVESSYNLAVIRFTGNSFKATVSCRSSVETSLDDLSYTMVSVARLGGFDVNCHGRYPGWSYSEISPLRDLYLDVWKTLTDNDGIAIGIHAGLECGLLISRVPDMDIISIGPDIRDLHSPSESMGIKSFDRLYDTVLYMLDKIN